MEVNLTFVTLKTTFLKSVTVKTRSPLTSKYKMSKKLSFSSNYKL